MPASGRTSHGYSRSTTPSFSPSPAAGPFARLARPRPGPAGGCASQLHEQGHRSLVDELDAHTGAKYTAESPGPRAEALVQRLGLLGSSGRHVAGPVAAAGVAI